MEAYSEIIPNNVNGTFDVVGENFLQLRDFFYYCCYSFVKSMCDHSIDHAEYINSTLLSCSFPESNQTREYLFELKKHSQYMDRFVKGPIIIFHYDNHKVSDIQTFSEPSHEEDIIAVIFLTMFLTIVGFSTLLFCMFRSKIEQVQKLLVANYYEEL